MKITQREWRLVEVYLASMKKGKVSNVVVTRRSDREFDLGVEGMVGVRRFGAWLMLGCISTRLNWCLDEVAKMTDYPEMVREGDWSGVRDTDNEKLWAIFKHFKLDEIKAYEQVIISGE